MNTFQHPTYSALSLWREVMSARCLYARTHTHAHTHARTNARTHARTHTYTHEISMIYLIRQTINSGKLLNYKSLLYIKK